MTLTILEGSTFCICDERGDVHGETDGFFCEDTRHLSIFRLTVNGKPPLLLSSGKVEYFSAAFYLRNPLAGDLPQDALSIVRTRFVGDGMQDRIMIRNESMEPVSFDVGLEVASDFADIFSVKDHDFALGDPLRANPLPDPVENHWDGASCLLEDGGSAPARTQVAFSRGGSTDGRRASWRVELNPRQSWDVSVDVFATNDSEPIHPIAASRRFGEELARVRDALAAWQLRVPQIRTSWDGLGRAFDQSVSDLASLRMRGVAEVGALPAAGMPWFMTVFGRDTLITCLQTLLFGPELARNALFVLAALQAQEDDPSMDAEPGKIVHEVRHGKAARNWFHLYYGTNDATPLYLVLLSEVWNWTDDAALVRQLRGPAMKALEWIDAYGDLDGDGFVEFHRRAPHGLAVQSWKDSGDSQRFHDGRIAESPIAAAEVQGYVFDVLRPRARSGQDARRFALLEHRAPALVGHRAPGAGGRDHRPADGRGPLVGLGGADDVLGGRGVQPAQLPQWHRVAARQLAGRVGACALRTLDGLPADRAADARRGRTLRLPAPGGLRGPAPRGDAVPDRLPDRGAAAGLGRGDARPPAPASARHPAGPAPTAAGDGGAARAALVGG
jgi:glycogen debranching enzyme